MRVTLYLLGTEFITLDLTLPRLGLFAPGSLPESFEALETLSEDD